MKEKPIALIIDDEVQIRRLLRMILESEHYTVFDAENGQLGLSEAVHRKPDVILLDLGLPDMDGLAVLKRLREWSNTPVLILSVRGAESDKVAALDAAADDYVTKPFSTAELLARLRVLQRRASPDTREPFFVSGELQVDFDKRIVTLGGKEIKLSVTEYALLKLLVQNAGRVLTHKHILREIWGPTAEGQAQYLRVYITHLRRKLDLKPNCASLIKTEPGIGYRFVAPETS